MEWLTLHFSRMFSAEEWAEVEAGCVPEGIPTVALGGDSAPTAPLPEGLVDRFRWHWAAKEAVLKVCTGGMLGSAACLLPERSISTPRLPRHMALAWVGFPCGRCR